MLILTHTEVTNTISAAYTTLDYGQRHKNKRTGLVLVASYLESVVRPRKLQDVCSTD